MGVLLVEARLVQEEEEVSEVEQEVVQVTEEYSGQEVVEAPSTLIRLLYLLCLGRSLCRPSLVFLRFQEHRRPRLRFPRYHFDHILHYAHTPRIPHSDRLLHSGRTPHPRSVLLLLHCARIPHKARL